MTPTTKAAKARKPTPMQVIETVSHPSRWALLKALNEPKTAQVLSEEVDLTVANIIYHMRFLVNAGVVKISMDPKYKSRQVYHRRGFLAEVVVDYDNGNKAEATFTRIKKAKA